MSKERNLKIKKLKRLKSFYEIQMDKIRGIHDRTVSIDAIATYDKLLFKIVEKLLLTEIELEELGVNLEEEE